MAAPLLIGAGALLAHEFLNRPVSTLTGNAVGNWLETTFQLEAAKRAAHYIANFRRPNVIIPAEAGIELFWKDMLDWQQLVALLRQHGVDPGIEEAGTADWEEESKRNWWKVIEAKRPILEATFYLREYRRGRLDLDALNYYLKRHGIKHQSDRDLFVTQWENLPAETAIYLWKTGVIDDGQVDQFLLAQGFTRQQDRDLMMRHSDWPSPAEVNALLNRGLIPESEQSKWFKRAGLVADEAQEAQAALRREVPSVSELIHFEVRNAFNDEIAARFQYDAEQPDQFPFWMDRIGLGYRLADFPGVPPSAGTKTWPGIFWRAHWAAMSPGQGGQAYARFRTGRIDRYQAEFPGLPVFGPEEYKQILQIANYAPAERQWLMALSKRPLGMRALSRVFRMLPLDGPKAARAVGALPFNPATVEEDVTTFAVEELRDLGHAEVDARRMASIMKVQAEFQAEAPIRAIEQSYKRKRGEAILASYEEGALSDSLTRGALSTLGWTQEAIDTAMQTIDAQHNLRLVKAAKNRVRQDYTAGVITIGQAQQQLADMGLDSSRVAQDVAYWQTAYSPKKKQLAAAQIASAVCDGWMSYQDATSRLRNLGWIDPDWQFWLAKARACQTKKEATVLRADQQAQRSAASALVKQLHQMEKDRRATVAALRRAAPPSRLMKWVKGGSINRGTFRERMRMLGYTDNESRLYYGEATGTTPDAGEWGGEAASDAQEAVSIE